MVVARQRHSIIAFFARYRATIAIVVVVAITSSSTAAAVSYLVLGSTNSAATKTTLKSGVNDAVLQLTNTNSTGGTIARGLGITVPAGRAPIVVNADAGKATNLNADKLDGINSSGFARGTNVTVLANRMVLGNGDRDVVLLTLPGLGVLTGDCPTDNGTARIYWANTTGALVDMWENVGWDQYGNREGDGLAQRGSFLYGRTQGTLGSSEVAVWFRDAFNGEGGQFGDTLILGQGNDPGPRRTATVSLAAFRTGLSAPCGLQATATLWSTP